jgi:hypothetical protein
MIVAERVRLKDDFFRFRTEADFLTAGKPYNDQSIYWMSILPR